MTRKPGFRVSFGFAGGIAGLILSLPVLVLVPDHAAAEIRATRSVTYDFVVDPPVVSLARIEELRPEGVVVNAWMTVIPDKAIPASGNGSQIITALSAAAARVSQTFSNKEELEAAFGVQATPVGQMIDFAGAKLKMTASFNNNPAHQDQLRGSGFAKLDNKSFELEGVTYTLSRWVKKDDDLRTLLGTASAILNLEAHPTIGNISSQFTGNFTKTDSSEISADGLPESSAARDLARARYEAFREDVNDEFNMVLMDLNEPQPMLSDEERLELADFPAGTEMRFSRTLSYDWFDEKKEVNIVIKATLGPLRLLDDEDEPAIAPFKDD